LRFLPRDHWLNQILGRLRRDLRRRHRPGTQPSGATMVDCWLD
jgi:hypothetical protein